MTFLESSLTLLIALVVLVKSSHWVLDSAIRLAEHFGIAEFATGYVFIAFATSFPDLIVSVIASSSGAGSIALGDVLGSSIANIALVLGVTALLRRVDVKREQTIESAELLFIVAVLPLLLLYRGSLGFAEGVFLILIFHLYLIFVVKKGFTLSLKPVKPHAEIAKTIVLFAIGVAVLIVSGKFVVGSAIQIAQGLNVPQAFMGLTIISFGTTLPELMVDFAAIRRGKVALALGDIFGSCVINLTVVLGVSSILGPISNGVGLFTTGFVFLVAATMFVWYLLIRHEGISRRNGLVLLLAYVAYIMAEAIVAFSKTIGN
ncbi:sodium:calcium antiporter [Candidatus Micrarchaeota archaeon]|nr:sodium:calcium antiporter [Candidatus Micrarchaeota archaeon]MBI5177454.1 sodium:calcium antiporter [Candidatus Micrarchaeota archaeon]